MGENYARFLLFQCFVCIEIYKLLILCWLSISLCVYSQRLPFGDYLCRQSCNEEVDAAWWRP